MLPPSAHLFLYAAGIILISALLLLGKHQSYPSFNITLLTFLLPFPQALQRALMKVETFITILRRIISPPLEALMCAAAFLMTRQMRQIETSRLLMQYDKVADDQLDHGIAIADSSRNIFQHNLSLENISRNVEEELIGRNISGMFTRCFPVGEPYLIHVRLSREPV
jgi:hypothetical protein